MSKKTLIYVVLLTLLVLGMRDSSVAADDGKVKKVDQNTKAELLKKLTPNQFNVTQKKATEPAFLNEFWNNHQAGTYKCVVCGEPLFCSTNKFDSGCGWPSFYQPLKNERIGTNEDHAFGMARTEVVCQ